MSFKAKLSPLSPVAAGILILGCAAYALTVLALHQSSKVALNPTPSAAAPTPSLTLTRPSTSPPTAPGPSPIWSDEFDGAAGRPPADSKWNHDVGGGGWGNGEWEYYTDSTRNAALDGAGHLVITARRPDRPAGLCATGPCDITSGRLQTDGTFSTTYGRVEARLQAPAGHGLWSAFWMVAADDSAELDIMEQNGGDPNIISGTAHIYKYTAASGISRQFQLPPTAPANTFHVYAIDWSPEQIVWSVDGQPYNTVRKSDTPHWAFDRPFYILLNLAVGADDPGYPDATTPFPARLIVDYVRVYR
ncbi:MAG: glycoside hydrolase family 16 protein [Candidatus Saccharimonadales bacterium]